VALIPKGKLVFPAEIRIGRFCIGIALAAWLFVAFSSLVAELALAERQIPIFGRDYRRFHTIDTAPETLLFLSTLLAAHLLAILVFFWILRRLHRRRGREPVFAFNFLFLTLTGAALAAKFRILSYFSEAVGFQVIRNLGGGSLLDAFLYVADEAVFLLGGLIAAALVYAVLYRAFGFAASPAAAEGRKRGGPRFVWLLAALLPVAFLLFESANVGDTRQALDRFLGPYLLYAALDKATDFDRDGYSLFSHQRDASPFDSARHPFALDVPGNGEDEDGYGGDFAFTGGSDDLPTPAGIPDQGMGGEEGRSEHGRAGGAGHVRARSL
jgi:hypothetical protein